MATERDIYIKNDTFQNLFISRYKKQYFFIFLLTFTTVIKQDSIAPAHDYNKLSLQE
ncbi:hypothetical protein CIT292_06345 [Citrobacter youngae ATCC 29220]|uniref:Uncharacterized protein n=1 Tax=Citrobacter youngae ATCC 29220 TaxID=500640 RepID=D4B7U1_9ENTR|nr:hypothetical protein CIT292_06345 [Citrobacter youngae ATCC 29220]